MAIRYVDIEPENGKAPKRPEPGKPAGVPIEAEVGTEPPLPQPPPEKPKRKRR